MINRHMPPPGYRCYSSWIDPCLRSSAVVCNILDLVEIDARTMLTVFDGAGSDVQQLECWFIQ